MRVLVHSLCLSALFFALSSKAYIVFPVEPERYGMIHSFEKGKVSYQPCGSKRPEIKAYPAVEEMILICQIAHAQSQSPTVPPLPVTTDDFVASLLGQLRVPTSTLSNGGSPLEVLLAEALAQERLARQGNDEVSSDRFLTLMQLPSLLEGIEDAQGYDGETEPATRGWGEMMEGAFTPTFSDGKVTLKIGPALRPGASFSEACGERAFPASLYTLLLEGPNGVNEKAEFLAWLDRYDSRPEHLFWTWQDWYEPKTTPGGQTGFQLHPDHFLLTVNSETIGWMEAHQEVFWKEIKGEPLSLEHLPSHGRPFQDIYERGISGPFLPLCLRRAFGQTSELPELEVRKAASVLAALDLAVLGAKVSDLDGELQAELHRLMGTGLPDYDSLLVSELPRLGSQPVPSPVNPSPVSDTQAEIRRIQSTFPTNQSQSRLNLGSPRWERISEPGERDRFEILVEERGSYALETIEANPSITMHLDLQDSRGNILASNNHGGRRLLNAKIERLLEPGTYTLVARHFYSTQSSIGAYQLLFSKLQ